MYDYTQHRGRKHFCRYCLQTFRTADVLKCHINHCFKINGKQSIKKVEYAKFKNYERKIKSSFMIYAAFESILVPENNGELISNESYTNKCQKRVVRSYGYQLVCVDDKFSKLSKSHLSKDDVFSFIMSLEYIESLHIEIVISRLTKSQNSCRISQPKKSLICISSCKSWANSILK